MSYIVSWSGGKDCSFACYKAILKGCRVTQLLNLRFKGSSHSIENNLLRFQAESIGIPLIQKETLWEDYESDFKETVRPLVLGNVEGVIFGDIFCTEFLEQKHKEWAEKVCGELGIKAVEPLWGMKAEEIYREFLAAGFEALIISLKRDLIDEEWLGRKLDLAFLDYLTRRNLNACGELGEYHTLVIGGPLLRKKINILESKRVKNEKYAQLEVLKFC